MSQQSHVGAWLGDAYRVEHTLTHVLEGQGKEARHHPQLQARLDEHLTQTKQHATMVKSCLARLGAESAEPKPGVGGLLSLVREALSGAADDETVVKNGIAGFAAENVEIGIYTAIIAAAESSGDAETAELCRAILRDEEQMAAWLDQHLPALAREYAREAIARRA